VRKSFFTPTPALEDLELEQVIRSEDLAEKTSDFTEIYTDKKVEEQQEEDDTSEDSSVSSEESSDSVDETAESDTDTSTDKDEESDEAPIDIPDEVSAESLRYLSKTRGLLSVSNEGLLGDGGGVEGSAADAVSTVENIVAMSAYLAIFGIKATAQAITRLTKLVFKGVLYIFGRLGYAMAVSMTALEQTIRRQKESFSRLEDRIAEARKALEAVEVPEGDLTGDFGNVKVLNRLKIKGEVNLLQSLPQATAFVNQTFDGISKSVRADLQSIRYLIELFKDGTISNAPKAMVISTHIPGLVEGTVAGYDQYDETVTPFRLNRTLPGDIVLAGFFPRQDLEDISLTAKAYNNSMLFLAIDKEDYQEVLTTPFLSKEDLSKILDLLEELREAGVKHQVFYEDLKDQKLKLRYVYHRYFEDITKKQKKVSISDSLAEYVYLRNNFIDRVYLPGAMDTHTYIVRLITSTLTFVEKNLKAF